jgi:tetratricopeptide (TPR) repeat protein
MATSDVKQIPRDLLLERISERVAATGPSGAACTLILGAGFSAGLVPIGRQLIDDIVRWGANHGPVDEAIWRLKLDAAVRGDGPQAISDRYCWLMGGEGPLHTPHLRRKYMREVVSSAGKKLNPAHLFLAGILSEMDRDHPFCRTIFTTNFDPFLQKALQLAGTMYFMSDRPDSVEAPDDSSDDAVHLFYAHGSIHRYFLCNDSAEIIQAKRRSPALSGYFQNHCILVIGYGGWDDILMAAIGRAKQFEHELFWCGYGPLNSQSPRVQALLKKQRASARYVEAGSADGLMEDLYKALNPDHQVPEFILRPLDGLIDRFRGCREMTGAPAAVGMAGTSLSDFLDLALSRLEESKIRFEGTPEKPEAYALLEEALLNALRGELDEAIRLWTQVIEMPDAPAEQRARALFNRGVAYGRRGADGDIGRKLADYTAVIGMPAGMAEDRAKALVNRGFTYGQRGEEGDVDLELADYTAVAEMQDAPVGQRATALLYRGITYGQRGAEGDVDLELADYTAVIEMPDAPAEQRARALFNRGVAYGQRGAKGDVDRELADYTAVIEMPDAPAEQRAKALVNRGVTYGQRGAEGDVDMELADYTAVIEMQTAPADQRVKALLYRGITYGQRGAEVDLDRHLADFTAVIEMPDAPVEERAEALVNRATAYLKRSADSDLDHAWADCVAVLRMPDAPGEQKAGAQYNSACVYARRATIAGAVNALRLSHAEKPLTQAMLDGDTDFDAIRDDAEFQAFRATLPLDSPDPRQTSPNGEAT